MLKSVLVFSLKAEVFFKGTLVMFHLNLLHIAEPTLYSERHKNGKMILLFAATLYYSCMYIPGFFHEVTCFTPNGAVAF